MAVRASTYGFEKWKRSVVSDSLRPHGLYSPWNPPGHVTGVGSFSLLQGVFPTQGSNPGLLHCRQILYQLSHEGSPKILEWVAHPFSRDLPHPGMELRQVSCIAGGFFTNWAIREALWIWGKHKHSSFGLVIGITPKVTQLKQVQPPVVPSKISEQQRRIIIICKFFE